MLMRPVALLLLQTMQAVLALQFLPNGLQSTAQKIPSAPRGNLGMSQSYMNKWHKDDVKLGIAEAACDDAKSRLDLDWPGFDALEYTCPDHYFWQSKQGVTMKQCHQNNGRYDPRGHICTNTQLKYSEIPPVSGNHRPQWPKYGEYLYVPPQRWMHNMEHGAVVLLYHPCADREAVETLKSLVRSCLRRHIITPYRHLPKEQPLALVAWGCRLLMAHADLISAKQFILDHALQGGENVPREGKYKLELKYPANIVPGSDFADSKLCPRESSVQHWNRDIDMPNSDWFLGKRWVTRDQILRKSN